MKMLKKNLILLLFVIVLSCPSISCFAAEIEIDTTSEIQQTPVPFIIDTDFSSDVDDALAISTAMYYQNIGMINVRGIALCCSSARGAHAMSALLGQHEYWGIPISCDWDDGIAIGSKYHMGMTEFPHKTEYFGDTVNFYRMMLASSAEKVNIVVLGQIININDLLNSGPDVHSQLNGHDLIAEKVDTIYFVGGKSNGKLENNIFYGGEKYGKNKYYNNTKVAEAAKNVANSAPCKMVWMEADVVGSFSVGGFLEQMDKKKNDILTRALEDYGTIWGSASFDPFGIHIAALDANNQLQEHLLELQQGTMRINLNGTSCFTLNDQTRNHYRIQKLANDGFYQSEINKALEYEYMKRN